MATNVGRVGIVMKGTWSSSATYEVLDGVTYNSSFYIAKQAVPAGTLPTNTTYWQLASANNFQKVIIEHTWEGTCESGTRYTYHLTEEYPQYTRITVGAISLSNPLGAFSDADAIMSWNFGGSLPNNIYIQYNCRKTQSDPKSYIVLLVQQ